jgi:hypothetical protein
MVFGNDRINGDRRQLHLAALTPDAAPVARQRLPDAASGYVSQESYAVFFQDIVEDILAYLAGSPARRSACSAVRHMHRTWLNFSSVDEGAR